MFWIKHPKPFLQRPVAMQVVARKGPALRDLRVIVVETPPNPGTGLAPADPDKSMPRAGGGQH